MCPPVFLSIKEIKMLSMRALRLIKLLLTGDKASCMAELRDIESEERSKKRGTNARILQQLIDDHAGDKTLPLPESVEGLRLTVPHRPMDSIITSKEVRETVDSVIREWKHQDLLMKNGLPPRNIMLLCGLTGNGKTSLAQAIATEVGLPFGLVEYDSIISSYMGDIGRGIATVFRVAEKLPCLLFFDEADSIVTSRSVDPSAASKSMNQGVNQLLISLDNLPKHSMVIFATNRETELDSAMIRRVNDLIIRMDRPGPREISQMISLCRRRWPILKAAKLTIPDGTSFAAIEAIAMAKARQIVLSKVATASADEEKPDEQEGQAA
jgi:SpoVK/Ycf46/Vps4 family AAA+-type ATPase